MTRGKKVVSINDWKRRTKSREGSLSVGWGHVQNGQEGGQHLVRLYFCEPIISNFKVVVDFDYEAFRRTLDASIEELVDPEELEIETLSNSIEVVGALPKYNNDDLQLMMLGHFLCFALTDEAKFALEANEKYVHIGAIMYTFEEPDGKRSSLMRYTLILGEDEQSITAAHVAAGMAKAMFEDAEEDPETFANIDVLLSASRFFGIPEI